MTERLGRMMPSLPQLGVARAIKHRLVEEVRDTFNDRARGERPVVRREDGLFGSSSVIWRVHGDVATMMIGGVAALLLQMLHPAVLAGVWDHSRFRHDMLGRLRRTARFIALTTYGGREEAEAAIAQVRAIHEHVRGTLPDGRAYAANDPRLLAWVHVTEAVSFLDGWIRYGEPAMPAADQDRYFAEIAVIAHALGADPVPRSRAEAEALMTSMRGELVSDARTQEVVQLLLGTPARKLSAEPAQRILFRAAVDLLPRWAREMHGLPDLTLGRPIVRSAASGLARTLRWAFS
ncbi:oxygenase MpaB family protein [Flavisphingomonas formosensis]|uniref:oxygenase MpaB family protein n=1 Tax=Flavisphingomonas formosensis TaxID=861534 RepID=UPI001E389FC4|nr:oxygenase MpaB family protein [Sphingomonas formosensis]